MKTSLMLMVTFLLTSSAFAASELICEKVLHSASYDGSETGKINKRIKSLESSRGNVEVTHLSTSSSSVGSSSAYETRCVVVKY